MYLYSDPNDDVRHPKDAAGAYEWWYFDALDPTSGYGIVIIFYDGLLFSPDYHSSVVNGLKDKADHHPGFSLSVYNAEKTVFYSLASYTVGTAHFGGHGNPTQIGLNRVEVRESSDNIVYDVHIDETLPSGLKAVGVLRFESPLQINRSNSGNEQSNHRWNLVQPAAIVTGEVQLSLNGSIVESCTFNTRGYHDHNIGLRPLDHDFDDWYWGRIHIGDDTLVWYNMRSLGKAETKSWLFENGEVDFSRHVDMKPIGSVSRSIFGLEKYGSWEVRIHGKNYRIVDDHVWDNGPFYQRYRVKLLDVDNQAVEGVQFGIAEYIKPGRITANWVRPMIRIRHHQSGSWGNWIQRSAILSRRTW